MPRAILCLRTLLIGALGGIGGHLLGLPLGWLLGAMATTVPLAILGVAMPASERLRNVMVAVLGVMLGSAFTPQTVARAPDWIFSLLGVALYVALIAAAGVWFCHRIGRQDRMTAAFAATPGGLSEMLALGPAMGADVRGLSLVHGTRLVIILMVVPSVVVGLGAGSAGGLERGLDLRIAMPLREAGLLLACLAGGMALGRGLRLPAGELTGPLALSAAAHLAGWITAPPPQLMMIAAQVVIGVSVARFFAGLGWRQMLGGMAVGAGLTAMMLALAALFALGFRHVLSIPFATAFLALVPGGLPEMSLVAISLGIDPAFVGLHHLFRVALVLVLAPVLIPRWAARRSPPDDPGAAG